MGSSAAGVLPFTLGARGQYPARALFTLEPIRCHSMPRKRSTRITMDALSNAPYFSSVLPEALAANALAFSSKRWASFFFSRISISRIISSAFWSLFMFSL